MSKSAACACAACIAALAGCGSDDAAKRTFITKADALCRKAEPSFRIGGELTDALSKRTDVLLALIRQLRKLEAPPSIDGAVSEYLDALTEIAKAARAAATAERRGQRDAASRAFMDIRLTFQENVQTVKHIGFRKCSAEGDPKAAG